MAVFKLKMQQATESQQQQALVKWARLKKIPIIHIPNEGIRSVATAIWLKAMGLHSGASDLFIARPKNGLGGFWIELKANGKKPTPLQTKFLEDMAAEGYKTAWFDDWVKAKEAIEEYLSC